MMRLDRSRKGQDIWLGEKMIFFAIGAALGLGGMITGHEWLVWAAIVVLVIGFALRLAGRRGAAGTAAADAPADDRDSDWARAWDTQDEADRDAAGDERDSRSDEPGPEARRSDET
jgi:hypothetical protein